MWTKSQKISGGVLAVAVVAFAVDRWVLNPSEESVEASPAVVEDLAITPASRDTTARKPAARTPAAQSAATLANRLSSFAENRRYPYAATIDAFRPSDTWLADAALAHSELNGTTAAGTTGTVETTNATAAPAAPVNPIVEFAKRHTLSAVLNNKSGGVAIVDGKLYEIGRVVDGFKLIKVGVADVTFAKDDKTVTLRLPGQRPLAQIE